MQEALDSGVLTGNSPQRIKMNSQDDDDEDEDYYTDRLRDKDPYSNNHYTSFEDVDIKHPKSKP